VDPIAEAMRDLDAMLGADHPTPTSGQSMAERSKAAQGIGAHCFHPHYFHLLPVPTTFGATLYTTATGVTVAANQWDDTVCPFGTRNRREVWEQNAWQRIRWWRLWTGWCPKCGGPRRTHGVLHQVMADHHHCALPKPHLVCMFDYVVRWPDGTYSTFRPHLFKALFQPVKSAP